MNVFQRVFQHVFQRVFQHVFQRVFQHVFQQIKTGGVFELNHYRDGKLLGVVMSPNLIPNEGLDEFLNSTIRNNVVTPISSWYVSLFTDAIAPTGTETSANFYSTHTELLDYSGQPARPAWNHEAPVAGDPAGRMVSNKNSVLAEFTITALGAATSVYGATVMSGSSNANDATGKLLAATQFGAAREILEGDVLKLEYSITATST